MAPAASNIDGMDPGLYEAVVEGNAEEYEGVGQEVEQLGIQQVTPKGNTILHIAALYGHTHLVHKILEERSHAVSLLCARNNKNETALHITAREGHTDIISALIHYAKTCPELESGIGATDMLRMVDDDKDTALHKAVRKGHLEVVKLLVKEDPKFEFGANEAGETPVYLAAELQFQECLEEMLNNCERPVYSGPRGRTALHAAVINSESSDCTKLLLVNEACLCEVGDDWGWTPLHYAVKLHNKKGVCDILQVNTSAAYTPAGKLEGEWTTAIHIAVSENSVVLFEQILKRCPLCWEMVNSKAQNVVHEAILNRSTKMLTFILNNYPKSDHLVDEKDADGNTPLHLLAASNNYLLAELVIHHYPRLDGGLVFNKQHLTPLDIAYDDQGSLASDVFKSYLTKRGQRGDLAKKTKRSGRNTEDDGSRRKQMIQKTESITGAEIAKTHIVVVTLIATVTFTAGMTLPGGYNNNMGEIMRQGMPVLLGKSSFKAFIVTDAIAFLCSIASLIGYILLVAQVSRTGGESHLAITLATYSVTMLKLSLTGVVLAFITGMFAVLTLHSSAAAVGVCVVVSLSALALISYPFLLWVWKGIHYRIVREKFKLGLGSPRYSS